MVDDVFGEWAYWGCGPAVEQEVTVIPLHPSRTERHGRVLSDGSFIKVWTWANTPELLRNLLNGRLKEPDFVVVSPRSCDQYSAKLFCEYASTSYRQFGEVDYDGVSCLAYVTGRDQ